MPNDIDHFYLIRVQPKRASAVGDGYYVDEQGGLATFTGARRFRSLEEAEEHVQQRHDRDCYRFLVQRCSRPREDSPAAPAHTQLIDRLMEIPQPYRRTAYNWLRGKDVKHLLQRQGPEVYERHRRMLLDHDIDIGQKSTVVLLKPRHRSGPIRIGDSPDDNAPQHYVVPAAQRPSPVSTATSDRETEDVD